MSTSSPSLNPLHSLKIDKDKLFQEITSTPYEKVLRILNEVKRFISQISSHSPLIQKLNWVISIISNHSLYKYEILFHKDQLETYAKDNPELKHFLEHLTGYNEEFTLKKNKQLTKTAKLIDIELSQHEINELGLLTPSRNLKRKKQTTIINPKKEKDNTNNIHIQRNKNHFYTNNSVSSISDNLNIDNTQHNVNGNSNGNNTLTLSNLRDMVNKGLFNNNETEIDLMNHHEELFLDNEDNIAVTPLCDDSKRKQMYFDCVQIERLVNESNYNFNKILTTDFNIFELKNIVGYDNVLPVVGKIVFDFFSFNDQINTDKLDSFLLSLSNGYHHTVPYHNALHGSDVTQTLSLIIINSNFEEIAFTNINDLLSMITACLGHDLGHPGFNNNFQINYLSDIAIIYNDVSVLENYHAATLFKILRDKRNNIFEHFRDFDYKTLRKRIICQILATDMVNHGKVLGKIKGKITNWEKEQIERKASSDKEEDKYTIEIVSKDSKNIFEEQEALFDFVVHASDLAHNVKSFDISLQWVELLSNEFWKQGDKEKELGFPISFLCDRTNIDVPKSQVGFIKAFIIPVFDVVNIMFPQLAFFKENAQHNIKMWSKLAEEKRKTGFTPEKKNDVHN